jgi:hypothetical protein
LLNGKQTTESEKQKENNVASNSTSTTNNQTTTQGKTGMFLFLAFVYCFAYLFYLFIFLCFLCLYFILFICDIFSRNKTEQTKPATNSSALFEAERFQTNRGRRLAFICRLW